MNSLGLHWIAELYDCDRDILDNRQVIEDVMMEAVLASGATPLTSNFHQFAPQGVSGVIIISESHFTIHTWPELGYAAIDIFTCGDLINNQKAMQILKEGFRADDVHVSELKRGDRDRIERTNAVRRQLDGVQTG